MGCSKADSQILIENKINMNMKYRSCVIMTTSLLHIIIAHAKSHYNLTDVNVDVQINVTLPNLHSADEILANH